MFGVLIIGAGRIGCIHAANLHANPLADVRYISDVVEASARKLADVCDAQVASVETALADDAVNCVIIATSTDTHAELIAKAAVAGKAIFCEKPLRLRNIVS